MVTPFEASLLSLFTDKRERLSKNIPSDIQDFCKQKSDEKVMAVNAFDLNAGLLTYEHTFIPDYKIHIQSIDRQMDEYFGDYTQVICAACIHTEDSVLLLKLSEACNHVDGYKEGTLTYPQGHCTLNRCKAITMSQFYQLVHSHLYRELCEEIKVNDPTKPALTNSRFMHRLLRDALSEGTHDYSIYINKAGTTCRHICILTEIDLTKSDLYQENCESFTFESAEPHKHSVQWCKYQDLLKCNNVDDICVWVASSFSKVPFYTTTFIEPYLQSKEDKKEII